MYPLVSLKPGTWVVYILNILEVGVERDRREESPVELVWFVVVANDGLCIDVNFNVDADILLALAICENAIDIPSNVTDNAANIA